MEKRQGIYVLLQGKNIEGEKEIHEFDALVSLNVIEALITSRGDLKKG